MRNQNQRLWERPYISRHWRIEITVQRLSFFLDDDDNIYVHYQISISRIKTAAGIREARVWYSMANKLKQGDKVLAACVKREMNNCEYAEKSVYYNVDKILKVL